MNFVKDHILSKILKGVDAPLKVKKESLRSLLTLRKYNNREVTFSLPKVQAEHAFGLAISTSRVETDSMLMNVFESSDNLSDESCVTFSINKNYFINSILSHNIDFTISGGKEHALVEFSSPNIAKPFHIGHLRSTVVGNFVSNCAEKKFGHVTRLNYLGDWGAQVGFVKAGLEEMGISDDELFSDPVRILYKAYVNAHSKPGTLEKAKSIFSSLEHETCSRKEIEFWERIRHVTVNNLKKTYLNLNVQFDEFCYESDYRISKIKELLKNLENCGIANKRPSDGLLVLHTVSGNEIPLVREDGTSLYLSRDIAAAIDRMNNYKDCSNIFYVVDKSQVEHFENVANAVYSLTGKDIVKHISFGRVTGVSSRKGTTLLLQDILDKATDKMWLQQQSSENSRTSDPEVTRTLAVTALIVYILRHSRRRDFVFNWDLALQGKGDSGVKLQYTHCRLNSLEENCGVAVAAKCQPDLIQEDILTDIVLAIARNEEVIRSAIENYESSYVVAYLFKLCNLLSRSLSQIAVKDQPVDIARQRLLVYNKGRETLAKCMSFLGLKPLKQM